MDFNIRDYSDSDAEAVLDIFNHYATTSMAAYDPEDGLPPQFMSDLLQVIGDYPFVVAQSEGNVVGLAFLHALHPSPVFERTAELTYFIAPDFTRRGLGSLLLDFLEQSARMRGMDCLLASIARPNQASRDFHKAKGFKQCGLLEKVGRKFGRDLDVVYMQKHL
jgi:phosphinothricin acetyltransferase